MKYKVDEGFELFYMNLSYRRKFIRTLQQAPLCFLLVGFIVFIGNNLFINIIVPIVLVIIYLSQLICDYKKSKYDKDVQSVITLKLFF